MQGMIVRNHLSSIEQALETQAGVVLLGPRQVGKTTLAQDIAEARDAVYLDMERLADRQILEEPDLYLDEQAGKLVVIDEVQLMAGLFGALRGQIDRRRRAGHRTGQFPIVIWQVRIAKASHGVRILFVRILSGISRRLVCVSRQKHFAGSGPCWRMSRADC